MDSVDKILRSFEQSEAASFDRNRDDRRDLAKVGSIGNLASS
jgi:hypothetical protein